MNAITISESKTDIKRQLEKYVRSAVRNGNNCTIEVLIRETDMWQEYLTYDVEVIFMEGDDYESIESWVWKTVDSDSVDEELHHCPKTQKAMFKHGKDLGKWLQANFGHYDEVTIKVNADFVQGC